MPETGMKKTAKPLKPRSAAPRAPVPARSGFADALFSATQQRA
jgi:hypothetical protein